MNPQALKQAVGGQTKDAHPLRADGAARIGVARDDHLPPRTTIAIAAAAAAVIWLIVLIPFVLHAGS